MSASARLSTNRILRRLPANESALLSSFLEETTLSFGEVLCEAGAPIRRVFFPRAGVISLLARSGEGASLELGLLGREGMFGVPLVLGVAASSVRALVQGEGTALRADARRFRRATASCSTLKTRLHRYSHHLMSQFQQTAICNCFHSIESRTARWMLLTSDRMGSSAFTLTQAFLADMLGVRRPAVNQAARSLLANGLVTYSRGEVSILDRPGLEAAACSCYRVLDDLYGAL